MKRILKYFGYSIVPVGMIKGLEAASKNWQIIAEGWSKRANDQLDDNIDLVDRIEFLEREKHDLEHQIAQSKFIPSTKPNLDLAVDTIIGWGNNRTLATFLKRLLFKVDDSIIETAHKYIITEIKKRKLVNEEV